jgi:phosphomannomutase
VAAAIAVLHGHALTQGATIDTRDGLKLSWNDRWVHIRASGTEPASRVIAEAPDERAARQLCANVRAAIGNPSLITGH